MNTRERFKVTVKDRVTGEKTIYYVHAAGFQFNMRVCQNKVDIVRMTLENPTMTTKRKKNHGK